MKSLLLLLILGAIIFIWLESSRVRERVIHHCREICRRNGLQLLDETVAIVSISFRRTPDGNPTLFRIYQFDVSEDGTDRQRAYAAVTGSNIHHVRLTGIEGDTILYQADIQRVH